MEIARSCRLRICCERHRYLHHKYNKNNNKYTIKNKNSIAECKFVQSKSMTTLQLIHAARFLASTVSRDPES